MCFYHTHGNIHILVLNIKYKCTTTHKIHALGILNTTFFNVCVYEFEWGFSYHLVLTSHYVTDNKLLESWIISIQRQLETNTSLQWNLFRAKETDKPTQQGRLYKVSKRQRRHWSGRLISQDLTIVVFCVGLVKRGNNRGFTLIAVLSSFTQKMCIYSMYS